jgi:hypothetical protein
MTIMPIRAMDVTLPGGWRVVSVKTITGGLLQLTGPGDNAEVFEYPLTSTSVGMLTSGACVPSIFHDDQGKPLVLFMHRWPKNPSLVWICDQVQMGWVPEAPWMRRRRPRST